MTTIAVVTGNPKPDSRTHGVALAVADRWPRPRSATRPDRVVIDLADHRRADRRADPSSPG